MTISSIYEPDSYNGNGATRTFTVNFPFGEQSDLTVEVVNASTGVAVSPAPALNGAGTYDFTVGGTADPDSGMYPDGSVTLNTAPPAGYTVLVTRSTPIEQLVTLLENGPFPAKTVEGALDRVVMMLQEASSSSGNVLTLPVGDPIVGQIFPSVTSRLGKLWAFDAATGKIVVSDSTLADIEAGVPAAEAAAATATAAAAAAAASASAAAASAAEADADVGALSGASYVTKAANGTDFASPSAVPANLGLRIGTIKIWVQSADPGASAQNGDVWIKP